MRSNETAALTSVNKDNLDAYEADDWYTASGHGGPGWTRLAYAVYARLLRVAFGHEAKAANLTPNDQQLIDFALQAYEASPHTRIAPKGKNFSVFLPVASFDLQVNDILDQNELWAADWRTLVETAESKIPGISDPDAAIDQRLPLSLLKLPFSALDLGFEEEEALPQMVSTIKGLRLNAAPNRRKFEQALMGQQQVIDTWALGRPQSDRYSEQTYAKALLRTRRAVIYFEIEVSAAAATHICQGKPSLGSLGEYFGRMMQWLFGSERDYVHNIVPISRIEQINRDSGFSPVARTDENGLAVDSHGDVLWLPTVENAEFVEAEIEAGGIQPDGEWTRLDAIDPEKNEYVTVPGAGGRQVRMRKPKGRNRLIFTDWHNSRLSYTTDDGKLQLLDLSMYRKAKAGQIAKILNSSISDNVSGRASAANLAFAVERGASVFGFKAEYDATHFEPYMNQEEAQHALDKLNGGRLGDYVEAISDKLAYIHRMGIGSRRLSAEEMVAFDAMREQWLTLDAINANSVIPMARPIAGLLTATFDQIMKDPSAVFGRLAVTTTLKEMAALLVVAKYGGKFQELHAIDIAERAKYLAPELEAVNDIEVRDIPYVSGSVELFPHQVKAWNYLKNCPDNVILDVAAGGGKTLLALLDIAYQIGKGLRRPLVICPGDLIKNYINDAQWLFKGRMNMVVINATTFESKEWGEANLKLLAQHAPLNTIFLTDYDFIIPKAGSKRMVKAMYGTEEIRISLNNEFLKSVEWGGIWMDESHLTKNGGSSTNRELQRLIAPIPVKRQLSGTYISDNLTDVVGEFSLINPQTFGDMADFEDRYYSEGTRRSAPVPGAQRQIYAAMAENANVITIRRKEWAALLPRRYDRFHAVSMSPAQQALYDRILAAQKQELLERAATDAELKAMLGNRTTVDEDGNVVENNLDELLDGQLSFVFQRLEQYVTAPSSDELGAALSGADRRSPKLNKVEEIIRQHFADGIEGKILIWTQYVESSANMYAMLSPDLQAQTVHYKAGTAEQAMAEFESNPKKRIMIGCEKSMNTGHNFQFCARIIRLETVWNYGTLEQGESRINRPKTDDPRREENGGHGIFYDWVFCDKSIDVTKNSRMITKLIATIKFYERDNQSYQDLPDLTPVRLSQNNIFSQNSWDDPDPDKGCEQYFKVYEQYQQLEQQEFDRFVADPNNRVEGYTLEETEMPPGSALLKRVPYVPQMKLYQQEQLGLMAFVDYISTEYADKKKTTLLVDDLTWDPAGMKIHTEYGDGVCKGFNKGRKSIRVTTPSGGSATVPITMAWVITKDVANGTEMRTLLSKRIGAITTEKIVPQQIVPPGAKQLKTTDAPAGGGKRGPQDDATAGSFDVNVDSYNEFIALVVTSDDPDVKRNLKDIEALGFIPMPHYHYSYVKSPRSLRAWIAKVQTKATIHARFLQELEEQLAQWTKSGTLEKFAAVLAAGSKRRFLTEQKLPAPKGEIRPYLVSHNNEVFLCMNVKVVAPTFNKVKAVAVPGITWKIASGEHWFFGSSKQEVQNVLKRMFTAYTITNREEAVSSLAAIRIVKKV